MMLFRRAAAPENSLGIEFLISVRHCRGLNPRFREGLEAHRGGGLDVMRPTDYSAMR